jgi:CheY-like chemotaxis protein
MTSRGIVLVVDDDPILREIASEMLRLDGYQVWTAEDGAIALELIALGVPDLVVMDMVMPNKDGVEAVQEVKARWPHIPVIAVSAGAGKLDPGVLLRAARALGADASMSKPLRATEFLPLVASLLDPSSKIHTQAPDRALARQ